MQTKAKLSPVTESLRRRDRLIAHRKWCRADKCPKCALLRVHEDMVDLRNGIRLAEDAGVDRAKVFAVISGVLHGGV